MRRRRLDGRLRAERRASLWPQWSSAQQQPTGWAGPRKSPLERRRRPYLDTSATQALVHGSGVAGNRELDATAMVALSRPAVDSDAAVPASGLAVAAGELPHVVAVERQAQLVVHRSSSRRRRWTRTRPPAIRTVSSSCGGVWIRAVRLCGLLSVSRSFTGLLPVRAIAVLRRRDLPGSRRRSVAPSARSRSRGLVSSALAVCVRAMLAAASDDKPSCLRRRSRG
jgi:hypothetical protein